MAANVIIVTTGPVYASSQSHSGSHHHNKKESHGAPAQHKKAKWAPGKSVSLNDLNVHETNEDSEEAKRNSIRHDEEVYAQLVAE